MKGLVALFVLIKACLSAGYIGGAQVSAEMTSGAKQWERLCGSCWSSRGLESQQRKETFWHEERGSLISCRPNNNSQEEKVSNPAREIKAEGQIVFTSHSCHRSRPFFLSSKKMSSHSFLISLASSGLCWRGHVLSVRAYRDASGACEQTDACVRQRVLQNAT